MRSTWGSKREVSPGIWELRYTIPKVGRKSETIRGTEEDADDYLSVLRIKYKIKEGYIEGIRLDFIFERFYLPSVAGLAPSSIVGYTRHYQNSIAPYFGNRIITSLQKFEVQEWLNGLSYGAARSALAVLRQIYNFAEDEELIENNVTRKRYKLPPKTPENTARTPNEAIYSQDEMLSILKDCRGQHWETVFILGAGAGLRRGEAFGPKLSEVEFVIYKGKEFALIPIKRSIQNIKGELTIIEKTKTPDSADTVAVPEPYSTRLREIVQERKGDIWLTDDGFGMPSNPDTISCAYKRWFSSVKYTYVPLENLRNSFSTMLHANGVDSGMVSKMLRHSTDRKQKNQTDYKYYFRPTAEHFMEVFISISKPRRDTGASIIRVIPGGMKSNLGENRG